MLTRKPQIGDTVLVRGFCGDHFGDKIYLIIGQRGSLDDIFVFLLDQIKDKDVIESQWPAKVSEYDINTYNIARKYFGMYAFRTRNYTSLEIIPSFKQRCQICQVKKES